MNLIWVLLWFVTGLIALFYFTYYSFMIYEAKKPNNIRKRKIFPKVSLVIPTYNEETTILHKLKNTIDLDYPSERLEIIVVDSASTDMTKEIVEDFIRKNVDLNLRLITQSERRGKANSLNYILPKCTGQIFVISDADSLLKRESLTQLVSNFADSTVGAVSGRQILLNPNQSEVTRMEQTYRGIYEILRIGESHLDSTPIFHGELSAFRRNLVNGVSQDCIADDTELSINVRKMGYRAIYDPEAVFYEYAPPTLKARLKQKQRRGQGLIQQFIRNIPSMLNRKYGLYGLAILPCEFFMHVISPILIIIDVLLIVIVLAHNLSLVAPIILLLVVLLAIITSLSFVSKKIMSKIRITINPIAFITTFLSSQICLLSSLSAFLFGKNKNKWEKIEDVRTLWKRKKQIS